VTKRRARCGSAALVTTILMSALAPASLVGAQQWAPPPAANLKVLPPGTDARTLVSMMRDFAQGLGVRCQHCHVYKGDDPNDLAAFDFASDEKTPKQTARTMMRMVLAINGDYLKDVGGVRPAGQMKVTCYTCHRGETRPLTERPQR
jgi:hypothetical protein